MQREGFLKPAGGNITIDFTHSSNHRGAGPLMGCVRERHKSGEAAAADPRSRDDNWK
jgi:hypothetical protein